MVRDFQTKFPHSDQVDDIIDYPYLSESIAMQVSSLYHVRKLINSM